MWLCASACSVSAILAALGRHALCQHKDVNGNISRTFNAFRGKG